MLENSSLKHISLLINEAIRLAYRGKVDGIDYDTHMDYLAELRAKAEEVKTRIYIGYDIAGRQVYVKRTTYPDVLKLCIEGKIMLNISVGTITKNQAYQISHPD